MAVSAFMAPHSIAAALIFFLASKVAAIHESGSNSREGKDSFVTATGQQLFRRESNTGEAALLGEVSGSSGYHSALKDLNGVIRSTLRGNAPDFDKTIEELNKRVSATEGDTDNQEVKVEQQQYMEWAKSLPADGHVCETGFNGGHSALVYLAFSQAQVFEFDLGQHDYSKVAEKFLTDKFPNRLTVTWGDSTKTLASFPQDHADVKCDLLIVDGGHIDGVARADLVNFANMAKARHRLVIDDTPCSAGWCEAPGRQWKALEEQGCLKTDKKVAMGENRGFTYGRYTPCTLWSDSVNKLLAGSGA